MGAREESVAQKQEKIIEYIEPLKKGNMPYIYVTGTKKLLMEDEGVQSLFVLQLSPLSYSAQLCLLARYPLKR